MYYYGMPTMVNNYTKICALDYPANLPYLVDTTNVKITGATKSGETWTVPASYGGWASKQYCDGAAVALAVAGTAIVTVSTSMY